MSVFTGTPALTCILPATNSFNPPAYDSRTLLVYPFGGWISAVGTFGPRTGHNPIAVVHLALTGYRATTFGLDDYYNRIILMPTVINLGNVISNVVTPVNVWNAYLGQSVTLSSIDVAGSSGGLTITGPAIPATLRPNQTASWNLVATTNGPPTIAATFTWHFSDGTTWVITVTGNRVTAWALTPDWSAGIRERLEFKTDVLRAWNGTEQRRSLRLAPRRTFDFSCPASDTERRYVESTLFCWSARTWALPIWPDGIRLAADLPSGSSSISVDTAGRDFVSGGLAMLLMNASTFEVVEISGISGSALTLLHPTLNTWPQGAKLYPIRSARLAALPKLSRDNAYTESIPVTFTTIEPCDWPKASGLPAYRGSPVLENHPNERDASDAIYSRDIALIDNETGIIAMDDRPLEAFPGWSHQWWIQGRAQHTAFRSLLYLLSGRQGAIWVPSYQADLLLMAIAGSTASSIDVQYAGYTLYASAAFNRRDIRIEILNGPLLYRRITGSVDLGNGIERLSLDSVLGVTVDPVQVRLISFMILARLDTDELELEHTTAIDGIAAAVTPWKALLDQ